MGSVAVIGGGVAGLTAALALRRKEHAVTLFEAEGRTGGVIRSVRQGGFLADLGPNSMLTPPPMVMGLLRDLNLMPQRIEASATSRRRYVVRGGRPVRVPTSPFSLATSPLFTARSKFRLLREPFLKSRPPEGEESLGGLVRRRLGQELVDYGLNPMVAGIYAGDPEQLSTMHAMASLASLEARYGSLIGGVIKMMRERRKTAAAPEGHLFSFRDGMEAIPDAITRRIARDIRLNTRVTRIAPLEGSWLVSSEGPSGATRQLFDAVICAAPSHALGRMAFEGSDPDAWRRLGQIRYSPVAVVVSGFRRSAVSHPLDGFGVLVPEVERRTTLGTLFSSTLFPERAPDGYATLTTFVGGARQPELALGSEADILAAVAADLRDLLGAQEEPVFRMVQVYPRAIPQYNLGYGVFKATMDALEEANPGLYFAGSYRNGVAVTDVMTSGALAAQAVLTLLGPAGMVTAGHAG